MEPVPVLVIAHICEVIRRYLWLELQGIRATKVCPLHDQQVVDLALAIVITEVPVT